MPHLHSLSHIFNSQPGWYCSDFHAHTDCSDGSYSPAELRSIAKQAGLDFLTITDHNDIRAFDALDNKMNDLVLAGIEVTLFEGHFNIFGLEGNTEDSRALFYPWLPLPVTEKLYRGLPHGELEVLIRRLYEAGLVLSINHPLLWPWEVRDGALDVSYFHCMEVINDPTYGENACINPLTRRLWSALLNAGRRIVGIGGSDFHSFEPSDNPQRESRLGLPLTYVFLPHLSGKAVLDGLRAGHVYISTGPKVEYWGECGGEIFIMGSEIPASSVSVHLFAKVTDCDLPATARLVANGASLLQKDVKHGCAELEFCLQPDKSAPTWVRFDVIGHDNQSLALANPIFLQPSPPPRAYPFGDFVDERDYPTY